MVAEVSASSILGRTDGPSDGEIHLWLVFQHEASSAGLLDTYRELLTEEERLRGARFYFEKHRTQYLLTRALIRTVLSRYSGVDPRAWRFDTNKYGRPHVVAPDVLGTLSFNIAHTEGLIVCACTREVVVGVDVEQVQPDRAGFEIADRYFSAAEAAELRAGSSTDLAERFFYYWTLKESYIKAIGTGLSTPLDGFGFTLAEPGLISLSFYEGVVDDPLKWRCWLMRPAPTYLVAICAERTPACAQRIVARRVVPFVSEELVACEMIAKTSG
jgi:4'-phosphopantetheinyl transferase